MYDGNPNGPCYCRSSNMDKPIDQKMVSEFGNDTKGTIRRYAVEMLNEGRVIIRKYYRIGNIGNKAIL